jgi:hypothetical protein
VLVVPVRAVPVVVLAGVVVVGAALVVVVAAPPEVVVVGGEVNVGPADAGKPTAPGRAWCRWAVGGAA